MKSLIDAMLPPSTGGQLAELGHDATTPTELWAHNLSADTLIKIAGSDGWVVVTDNAVDFIHATSCTVLLAQEGWWPHAALAARLAESLDGWAREHPDPGHWAHGLENTHR